jgi:short-subunit dehydrogenase
MRALRKSIVITGASSGLGRGMAREFARLGRDLALCARRLDRLEELRAELLETCPGIRVVVRTLDVTRHEEVFETFRAFRHDLGRLDRVVVNAGLGKGQPIGTGGFPANRQTVETNFVAALAQCEAAIEIFRAQNAGHLVAIASVAAVRGMSGSATAYAASKAGLVSLAEGIRADLLPTPIRVTTILPGYIRSEMNETWERPLPFLVGTEAGCKAIVRAIEREPAEACVPRWPWAAIAFLLRRLPTSVVARMS